MTGLAARLAALGSDVRLALLAQMREPRRLAELCAWTSRGAGAAPARRISRQALAEHVARLVAAGFAAAVPGPGAPAFVALPDALSALATDLQRHARAGHRAAAPAQVAFTPLSLDQPMENQA